MTREKTPGVEGNVTAQFSYLGRSWKSWTMIRSISDKGDQGLGTSQHLDTEKAMEGYKG